MPEYPIQHLAEKFFNLFKGNISVHGRSELTGQINIEGKHEARSWMEHQPTTQKLWERHLQGNFSIGQVPIKADGTVGWVAFDVDVYKNNLNINEILGTIDELSLPILLTRSKSGGAHGLIFFSSPSRMERIRPKIQELATFFGVGGCEIFPKQDSIGMAENADVRYGNWLNMPYDGCDSLRYGYSSDASRLSPSEFIDAAEALATTEKDFLGIRLPRGPETLEDGPPCLNHLTSKKMDMTGGRNTLLFNIAVYFKKANPEADAAQAEAYLKEWNSRLTTPLEEKELRKTILSSLKKREYRYQCGNTLLKQHCNSTVCANECLYGIDGDENAFDPNNKTLIQLLTDPCLYFIDYKKTQLVLTKEEFWSYEKVRQACMVQARHIPPKMDQEHWIHLVQGYLESVTIVELPPEATALGQLIALVSKWKNTATNDPERIVNGAPALDKKGSLVFKLQDLFDMLKLHRFMAMEQNKITHNLKEKMGMRSRYISINSRNHRCWEIPASSLQEAEALNIGEVTENNENF